MNVLIPQALLSGFVIRACLLLFQIVYGIVLSMGERRSKPRIYVPFAVRLRGTDESGNPFQVDTKLNNLSARGLHVCLTQPAATGSRLLAVVQFGAASSESGTAAGIAAHGEALRSERQPDGSYGVAMLFTSYRPL